ncbi:MAG TPA: protein kinase [Kofleriaceae bacterium]|nr:protein kinase [Kofleriaceae bacterium]
MTELPTSFGKYYLAEKLATGGMAEIYLAKIIGPGGFEKPVVIKQIHPKLTGQRHFVDLFVNEAKTLVTLSHGNIVPVYELGVIEDTYFIAMDYIDGPTLYRLTETMARREATMEPAVAAWITARMLEGLDYAHRKGEGVIHRDLSPRNVMLSRDGDVKLVDFGIAVTLGDPGEGTARESAPTGSFPYMSPEQVRREPLTGQTDLFSAGVLLWEMLTGQRLFARPDADATLDAVLRDEIPRPSSVRPEVPAKLDDVVMRALERDRGARWALAADMLAALNKYLYSLDETPGPRDVSALVARFCPPETRRLPTHLEAIAHDVLSPEPFGGGRPPTEAPLASGPSTAVIPRDQQARGKPLRQKSFATNVNLMAILEQADPLPRFEEKSDLLPSFDEKSDVLPAFHEAADNPTKDDRPKSPSRVDTPLDKPSARSPFAADTVIDDAPPVLPHAPVTKPPRAPTQQPGSRAPTQPPATKRRSRPMDTVDETPEEAIERPIRRTPRSVSSQHGIAHVERAANPDDRGHVERARGQTDRRSGSIRARSYPDAGDVERARNEAKRARSRAEPGDRDTEPAYSKERTAVDGSPLGENVAKSFRQPPSRSFLVLAGFGALALAGAAVFVFFQGRDHVLAMTEREAGVPPADGAVADVPTLSDAAPVVDDATLQPTATADADIALTRDAGTKHGDAPIRTSIDATPQTVDAAVAKGSGTLQVGADPWGEIYVDGKSMGRTPKELTVTAGHHTVEVVFAGETPPRKQTFAVDISNGETKPIQADFK